MQKLVLNIEINDDANNKKKAMKLVSSITGLESISINVKDKKMTMTLIGDMDPILVVKKLRKNYHTEIISVGPAKEPEKKKEEPKKPEKPQPDVVQAVDFVQAMQAYNSSYNSYYYSNPSYARYGGYHRSVEEDPNGCVIC